MEQRVDSNDPPEYAVGTDPAYVPGFVVPSPDGTGVADLEKTEEPKPDSAVPHDDSPEDVLAEEAADGEEAAADDTEEGAEGPVFEVSDRRGSIAADRDGVRFRLDDQEAEFLWEEIGAVEMKSARFGRRFTVTVHLSARRWFDAEVDAEARGQLKEWTAELDKVLDVYFEGA